MKGAAAPVLKPVQNRDEACKNPQPLEGDGLKHLVDSQAACERENKHEQWKGQEPLLAGIRRMCPELFLEHQPQEVFLPESPPTPGRPTDRRDSFSRFSPPLPTH